MHKLQGSRPLSLPTLKLGSRLLFLKACYSAMGFQLKLPTCLCTVLEINPWGCLCLWNVALNVCTSDPSW